MSHFLQLTATTSFKDKTNVVIMGKNTYISIPEQHRPLKGRLNYVVSSTLTTSDVPSTVQLFKYLSDAIIEAFDNPNVDKVFVIGGVRLCEDAMSLPNCSHLFVTEIDEEYPEIDVIYPPIPSDYVKIASSQYEENGLSITDVVYQRSPQTTETTEITETTQLLSYTDCVTEIMQYKTHDANSFEYDYLDCLKRVLQKGERCANRTGIDTLSVFDENMQFTIQQLDDGSYQIPILTTKKIFLKGAVTELLWMLRGGVSAKWLQERDVHIWDGNSTREYLDRIGLTDYAEGNWVRFMDINGSTGGVLTGVIRILKLLASIKSENSST